LWLAQIEAPLPFPPPLAGEGREGAEPETRAEKFGRFAGRAFADLRRRVREK
jgi:hypothetical protein